jgi:DNA-binding SARP family transcriptional activator/Tfp pilus assembly protein PilF
VEFLLLGPLLVRSGDVVVPVRPGKQRTVLAALLVAANRVVATEDLAEALWGGSRPRSAQVTLQNYVKRLRHALGDADRSLISTHPRGYQIRAGPGDLDMWRFRGLLTAAHAAGRDGQWQSAAEQAARALDLWRGDPLADVQSELLQRRDVPPLIEMRLQAAEFRADASLHLGRHAEVIDELSQLAAAHPLRERFWALLMLALYRSGRQADALAAYQRARKALVEELGAEPGAELRRVQHQVLTGAADAQEQTRPPAPTSAGVLRPGVSGDPGAKRLAVPRQLPAPVRGFAGRAAELGQLSQLLDDPSPEPKGPVLVSAIDGTAGVGKTALAVHWAHQVAARFPDGQLYVNLRGYDPGQPVRAGDALAGFLRALGVPGQEVPADDDERAARYRSLLASRRILVVLDNASDVEQVRLLLPGSPGCVAVVTSRDSLAGLVAREGAQRLVLDLLPVAEAVSLLRTLIGARVDDDCAAAEALAERCCRLPLALRLAGELAVTRSAASLNDLVDELADQQRRLDLLDADGDPRTAVRAVFSWSYQQLDTAAARAFRLLGLHPGPDCDAYAAAALTGASLAQARALLDRLLQAHLVQEVSSGRVAMHDLLRAYAAGLADRFESDSQRRAALTRLFDYYLHTAAAAMDTLYPAERHRRPRISRPATGVPPLRAPAAARKWLDGENASLVAVTGHTAAHGWPGHATRMAATLSRYLRSAGYFPEAITIFSHALGAARCLGDRLAEATVLNQIGNVEGERSRYRQAADHHKQALALFREAGDRTGEARVLANIGLVEEEMGRHEHAARHQQEAVAIYRDIGDRFGEARTLGNLGFARQGQGRYQEAAGYHRQALDLTREIGDRQGEAIALGRLGFVDLRLGRYQDAAGYLQQALVLFESIGDKVGQPEILIRLGEVYLAFGRYEQAVGNLECGLAISREIGDPALQACALNALGDVLSQIDRADRARAQHLAALRLASEVGSSREQARAHSGLARICQADGDSVQARHHWQEALRLYAELGAPEADQIRERLTTNDATPLAQDANGPGRP